jgi:hypothetical protein
MLAALPVSVHTIRIQHLTMQAVVMIMVVGIDSSLAKDIQISGILSNLFRAALTADMMIETDNLVCCRHNDM